MDLYCLWLFGSVVEAKESPILVQGDRLLRMRKGEFYLGRKPVVVEFKTHFSWDGRSPGD